MVLETREYVDEGMAIGLSEDEVHRLLGAGRRRLALEVLTDGGAWELEELAVEVLAREDGDPADERALRRTVLALYHRHLPLMDDLGAIDFDPRSRRVVGCRLDRR